LLDCKGWRVLATSTTKVQRKEPPNYKPHCIGKSIQFIQWILKLISSRSTSRSSTRVKNLQHLMALWPQGHMIYLSRITKRNKIKNLHGQWPTKLIYYPTKVPIKDYLLGTHVNCSKAIMYFEHPPINAFNKYTLREFILRLQVALPNI
jgi:hypothetical protein